MQTDNRLRAFFPDDSLSQGLLFGCQGDSPLLDSPLGECLCGVRGMRSNPAKC